MPRRPNVAVTVKHSTKPPVRTAAILAVGSELLTPLRLDTNSLYITEALEAVGIEIRFKSVVGDDPEELAAQFAFARQRADLIVLTGGLGPTADDVTREVVAAQLGRSLVEDLAITDRIRQRFERRGWTMPEINRRQAMVPHGAAVLANAVGTAPGLWLDEGATAVLLLPGPPREMKPMLTQVIAERLRGRNRGSKRLRRVLRIAGRSESRVEELTQPVYGPWRQGTPPIETTILAATGQIELHLSVTGSEETTLVEALDAATAALVAVLPDDVVSIDGRPIEAVVGTLLRERGWRITLAESCTGGLATSRLTDVPGSSEYLDCSVVAYSNSAKREWLGVPAELIAAHGAVSEAVALAMASGVRDRARVEVGVGITGIAGPGGGSESKPVGTVCIAVVTHDTVVRTFRFPGDREAVKAFSAFTALDMLRRVLVGARACADWERRSAT